MSESNLREKKLGGKSTNWSVTNIIKKNQCKMEEESVLIVAQIKGN